MIIHVVGWQYTREVAENTSDVLPHWGEYWNLHFYLVPIYDELDGLVEFTTEAPPPNGKWLNAIIIEEWKEDGETVVTQHGETVYKCLVEGVDGFVACTNACRRMTPYHMQKYGVQHGWMGGGAPEDGE